MTLLNITEQTHHVHLDMRYATTNNFTGQVLYPHSNCYLRSEAAVCLDKASILARQQGLRLRVLDAYRPQIASERFWEIYPDPLYVADPAKGSTHTRGIAVDVTLINAQGEELDMGSGFDEFHPRSHHGATDISAQSAANRYLLLGIMLSAGWELFVSEWWHYQLANPTIYPLIPDYATL